jgi:2,4-dienoyl-CoA reductase-like NADH-dependent reductase (Old Yellow Enzyme family)/thioredoxin reductase
VTVPLASLFQPGSIRGLRIRNRIVMCAMNDNLALPDGYPTQQEIDYYQARAAGGVGLIVTGNAFIDADASKISANQVGAHTDTMLAGLARLAEAAHRHNTAIILQLAHAGSQTMPVTIGYRQTLAPSASPHAPSSRPLTVPEIQLIIDSFAAAAARAEAAGFDGVEVHCGHGYLLSAFLSPRQNLRADSYGGSLENRARIISEIFDRTRRSTGPRFIVGAKFNATDGVPGGLSPEEGIELAKLLEQRGADYLAVSRGVGESADDIITPLYRPRLQNIPAAARVRDAVGIPVIAMGAVLDPEDASEIVRRGDADFVAVGRALIADPQWAVKARRGEISEIRPCIRCNECVALVDENRELRCAVNAEVGHEGEHLAPTNDQRRVVVLGGGPAGCEAARTAALRGHEVILVEAKDRLGGASVPRGNPGFKRELERLPRWYAEQLRRLRVDVRLDTSASAELVRELAPDVVVFALGAKPVVPDVPGADLPHVWAATDLLEREPALGDRVAVVGAGFVGCEVAVHLARQGRHTYLVTRRDHAQIASDLNHTLRVSLLRDLAEAGVEIIDFADIAAIREGALVLRRSCPAADDTEVTVDADQVVIARGFAPGLDLADQLLADGFDVRLAGEAVATGLIFHAVHQGYAAGATI